tara:strand:+ start:164 stop:514 length:351 start_codon:yes stop_codon:yes gene_type:complete
MAEIIKMKFNDKYKTIDKFTWSHGKNKVTVRIDLCKHKHWCQFDDGKIYNTDHAKTYTTRYKDPLQREAPSPISMSGFHSFHHPKINPKAYIKHIKAELNDLKNIRKYKKHLKEAA